MSSNRCGVDIGGDALKCAVGDGHAPRALWTAQVNAMRSSLREALTPAEWETRTIGLLRKAAQMLPGWTNRVTLGIQGFGTRIGYGELPPLKTEQAQTAVTALVGRELGGLSDLVISHMTVQSLAPGKMGVLWAACPSDRARSLVRVAQGAGLQIERFEVPILAVVRALTRNHDIPAGQWNVVVEVGFEVTTVAAFKDGIPYFSRDFWISGGHFTAAAVFGYGCSWAEAEQRKRAYDVTTREPVYETEVLRWLTELRRTRMYAGAIGHSPAPAKIYLTGGSSVWHGLAQRVEEVFGVPVVLDAWKRLNGDAPHGAGLFSTATGLVLEPSERR